MYSQCCESNFRTFFCSTSHKKTLYPLKLFHILPPSISQSWTVNLFSVYKFAYVDISYNWNPTLCDRSWLLLSHGVFSSHSHCSIYHYFLSVYCQILFHYMDIQHFCSSVAQLCPTHCSPMDCSMPGLLDLHHLLEFAQTHVHWGHTNILSSVISFSSYLQSFPASGSFPGSALLIDDQILELQYQSFQWIFRVAFLWDWLVWSPCCPRDS